MNREAHIHIRVEQAQKDVVKRAASLHGMTVSQYMMYHALKQARQDLGIV